MAREIRKRGLMNIIVLVVVREWLGDAKCVKEGDAGEKKQVRGPSLYVDDSLNEGLRACWVPRNFAEKFPLIVFDWVIPQRASLGPRIRGAESSSQ